jgi:glycosyltransferase involved in cell wall biosynthesis
LISGDKGTTLLINHSYAGGASIYLKGLIEERLARGEAVLLFTYDLLARQFKLIHRYREHQADFAFSNLDELEDEFERVPIKNIFLNNLVTFPQPLEVVRLGARLKRRFHCSLTIALHDFYALCPSFNLLMTEGQFCNLPDIKICRRCLPGNFHVHVRTADSYDIDVWRNVWRSALRLADEVLCFSENSRSLLVKVYPFLRPEQVVVRPHELPTRFIRKPQYNLCAPLHIGVVGDLGFHKGSQMVIEVAKLLAEMSPGTDITVIGKLDREASVENLKLTGPFQAADLPGLLEKHGINMCLFPSVWPETFSYVCSELMELGMPLCCYDLGAQGDRVRRYELGHIIGEVSPEATVNEILQFYLNLKNQLNESGPDS